MHAAIINSVVTRAARIDAPATAVAKAPDDGRFCDTLKAGVAVEAPADTKPAVPATPLVGKLSDAMMRPPDVSSPEDAVAKIATKAHEQEHSKASQDTGAVSVAKDATKKNSNEVTQEAQPIAPEVVSTAVAMQLLPIPLPAATLSEAAKPLSAEARPAIAATRISAKKNELATTSVAPDAKTEAILPASLPIPQAFAAQVKQSVQPATIEIAPINSHGLTAAGAGSKSIVSVDATPKPAALVDAPDMKTMVATPNVLEVGIATGTHGWLRVRAELGQMGEVTASLAATSASAADGLHKELPAISAYLANERVGVSSLVVNATGDSAAMLAAGGETGGRDRRQTERTYNVTAPEAGDEMSAALLKINLPAAIYANGSGSWLSVRV